MVIHKCDRCGAETDNPHTIFYQADLAGAASKSAELCDRCYDGFKDWLNGIYIEIDTDAIGRSLAPIYENHWREVTDKTERNEG